MTPPPSCIVINNSLDLLLVQLQHGPDGLQHVVLACHVGAQHVVQHHVLEVLLAGPLHSGHPLQLPDCVLQLLYLVLILFLFN